MSDQIHSLERPDAGDASDEDARLIDALMAQPIKSQPAVLVFGDDDVHGFTPIPRSRAG